MPAGSRRRRRGCSSAGLSGSTGSRRSRAACCRATSTSTLASFSRLRASTSASVNRLPRMEASVAVIGLGRVGLPLALSFADRGLRTIGVERQQGVLDQLSAGQMPFSETGTQELLEQVMEDGRLELTRAVQDAAAADHIVLTPHTPSYVHIEIDISHVRGVVDDLLS